MRMLKLAKRRFTCQITGHTGMTYWEASKSEVSIHFSTKQCPMSKHKSLMNSLQREGSKDVDTNFPERLRGPVLSKVNFSTISRIDELGWSYSPLLPGRMLTLPYPVAWLYEVRLRHLNRLSKRTPSLIDICRVSKKTISLERG